MTQMVPPSKALQTDTSDRHAFCIRKSRASLPLPLSLVVDMLGLRAIVLAALADAEACSFPSGYEIAEPVAPWIDREGDVPEEPKVKVLPLVRGYDDGNPASCSDAGILTILLPAGKPESVAYYWFQIVKGEFPDLVVPDAKLLPVEIGDDQVGFRFVWLDLPYGQRRLEAFDVTIEIRANSNRDVVGKAAVIELSWPA